MEFICLNEKEKAVRRAELLEMTAMSDREFVPWLSRRSSTVQSCLNESSSGEGAGEGRTSEEAEAAVLPYFEEMMAQEMDQSKTLIYL